MMAGRQRTDDDVSDIVNAACRVEDIQFAPSFQELRRVYKIDQVRLQRVIDAMVSRGELSFGVFRKRGRAPSVRYMAMRTCRRAP